MSISRRRGQSSTVVVRDAIVRLCHRSRDQLRLRRGCQQLGTFWWTTRPGLGTTGIGDTCDLSDGDLLIVHIDYLCDGMTLQMRNVRSDPLQRSFLRPPHLEKGFLDHSTRRRRSSCTVVVSRGWADGAEAASITRTSRAIRHRTTPLRCGSGGGDQSRDER